MNWKNLVDDIGQLVDKNYVEVLLVTNSSLNNLFCDIGNVLIESIRTDNSQNISSTLQLFSKFFTKKYGDFFSVKSLNSFLRFAILRKEDLAETKLYSLLPWTHAVDILNITDKNERLYLIKAVLNNRWDLENLRIAIEKKIVFQQIDGSKKNHRKKASEKVLTESFYTSFFSNPSEKGILLDRFFKNDFLPLFEALIGQKSIDLRVIVKDEADELLSSLEAISGIVDDYGSAQSRWLNGSINCLFFEIGSLLSNFYNGQNGVSLSRELFLTSIFELGTENRKLFFSKDQLLEMFLFANKFQDIHLNYKILSLIRWEHITLLLCLNDIELIFEYAVLVAKKNFSPDQLKQLITSSIEKPYLNDYNNEAATKSTTSITSTTTERKGNISLRLTKTVVDFGEEVNSSLSTRNIFENPHFTMLFNLHSKFS